MLTLLLCIDHSCKLKGKTSSTDMDIFPNIDKAVDVQEWAKLEL